MNFIKGTVMTEPHSRKKGAGSLSFYLFPSGERKCSRCIHYFFEAWM